MTDSGQEIQGVGSPVGGDGAEAAVGQVNDGDLPCGNRRLLVVLTDAADEHGAGGVYRLGIARRAAGDRNRVVKAHERAGGKAADHVAFAAIGRGDGVGVRGVFGRRY